ncbi:MAG: hypothetical protein LBR97_04085 [Dysgonamonadaceae bacterium]|jgi:hypothetical protein|nr:hypothetical protein [Dysgonamonadaceae bacterium]
MNKFSSYIFQKRQLIDWLIVVSICVLGYVILRMLYPYPAATADSPGYIFAAKNDSFFFYRPFGYSQFLQIVYFFSSSIHAVFAAQMFLYAVSIAFFALTIKYFFKPQNQIIWYALLTVLVLSPMSFFMANALMSDMLFAIMIFGMLAAFAFVVMKKSWLAFAVFVLLMFFALHIRYSAVVFPFLFIPVLLFVKSPIRWVSLAVLPLVYVIFHNQVKSDMKETTGFNQFSTGFDGWQLANNAIHIVPYIDLSPQSIRKARIRDLHKFVLNYKEQILETTDNGKQITTAFMWDKKQPLKQYLEQMIYERRMNYPSLWITLGSGVFKDYGKYLMVHYPYEFIRYYLIPSSTQIFYPAIGMIAGYGKLNGDDIFDWYGLPKDADLNCSNDIYRKYISPAIPGIYLTGWIFIFAIAVFAFVKRKNISFNSDEKILFWGLFAFGVIFYASTTFATPNEIRYWLPMSVVRFSFVYILYNKLCVYTSNKKK